MTKKLSFLFILLLLITNTNHLINVNSQETDTFILNINIDREQYNPGDTALIIISGNKNDSGKLNIYFSNTLIHSYDFSNLSINPFQVLWNIEPHSTNGTYQAIAIYNSNQINATVSFDIIRSDIYIQPDQWRWLDLNVTFEYRGNKLKNFDAIVTNLFTNETRDYDDNLETMLINEDLDIDDLIKYKPGNAIKIELKTIDRRFKGSIIIAAFHGINYVTVKADKLPDEKLFLSLSFVLLGIVVSIYIVYHVRQLIREKQRDQRKDFDPHELPEKIY